jgi:hypothetical protein
MCARRDSMALVRAQIDALAQTIEDGFLLAALADHGGVPYHAPPKRDQQRAQHLHGRAA